MVDGYDRLVSAYPQIEGTLARLAESGQAVGIHLVLAVPPGAELPPSAIRGSAGLRVDLDPETRGTATLSVAGIVQTRFQVADADRVPDGLDGAIRVQRPSGCTELSTLVEEVSGRPFDGAVWRPDLPHAPAGATRTRAAPARVELRFTVESAGQTPRDIAVDIDPERTVAELTAALHLELGLGPDAEAGVSLRRRETPLRPDQTVRSVRLRNGDVLVIGSRDAGPEPSPDTERHPDESGRIAFNRQPRPQPVPPDLGVDVPAAPERGQGSWRSLLPVATGVLTGLLMGGSMYLATGPGRPPVVLLMSVAATPVLALVTGIVPLGDVLRRRGQFRRAETAFRQQVAGLDAEIERAQAAVVAHLHEAAPDPETLIERARALDPRLWERRPSSDDWLHLRVGLRSAGSNVDARLPDGGDARLRAEAQAQIDRSRPLPPVPMVLPLAAASPLGLHGDRRRVGELARWLAVQLAVLHSPEELVIAAAVPTSERQQWAWLRWLPHVQGQAGPLPAPRLVAGGAAARALLHRLLGLLDRRRESDDRVAVVAFLHEDAGLPRGLVARLLAHGGEYGVHVVWIAGHRQDLPGQCRSAVGLQHAGGTCRRTCCSWRAARRSSAPPRTV
jgi:S-DNA-T family DNA segregation ATPase FtsK/SpoIIIE